MTARPKRPFRVEMEDDTVVDTNGPHRRILSTHATRDAADANVRERQAGMPNGRFHVETE